MVQPQWIQEVLNSYATDPKAQQLLTELTIVNPNAKGFSLHQGLIRKNNLIWIAQNSALQTKFISTFHSSAIGGHSGVTATHHRLKRHFHWKGMNKDVTSYIQQCSVCQQANIHTITQQVCSNLYLFLMLCGKISPWILLRGFPSQKGTLSF